jgi:bacteriocin biosynthesis cyclodehydratase domain-containing protein
MNLFRFKESFYVQVVEPDTVFLVSDNQYHLLTGSIYKELAPLLQEGHSLATLNLLLANKIPPAHLHVALRRLQQSGYVVEIEETSAPIPERRFWHAAFQSPTDYPNAFRQKKVTLHRVGNANSQSVYEALGALNLTIAEEGDITVVITEDYLHEDLALFNRRMVAAKQPWLPARLVGESVWVGPLFIPGKTACWECMAHRIRINRPVETFVLKHRANQNHPFDTAKSALHATVEMGANMVAIEVAKWMVNGTLPHLVNQFVTFNTLTAEIHSHPVVPRPQCSVCGNPFAYRADRDPAPVRLKDIAQPHRITPEEMLARYEQKVVDPVTGVVTHLIEGLKLETLGYVYISVHGFGSSTKDLQGLQRTLQGRSSGKGVTTTQAKLSAIGEAVERYSGTYWNEGEIEWRATYRALADKGLAIHPNDVWLYSDTQYAHRVEWNRAQKSNYHQVQKPVDPDLEIAWVPYYSLTKERFRYLPAFAGYYNHPDSDRVNGMCDSNGCAAGPTLDDAVRKGLFELIERDCAAMWWYNRLKRPRVDTISFGMPYVTALEAYYERIGRTLWVLDITADFEIPTFVAVSRSTNRSNEDILIGLGVDFDPKVALMRALMEINQFLLNVWLTNDDGNTRYLMDVEETVEWFKNARIEAHPHLIPDDNQPPKTLADFPYQGSGDVSAEVQECVRRAEQLGLEVFVLDQTRPDIGIPVARVVVPGLRHFWRRLAPGRLYEVPVKLGWLEHPLAEADLNPVSMFF